MKTAQTVFTQALAAATPPKPLTWHQIEQQTSTGTYERGVSVGTLSHAGLLHRPVQSHRPSKWPSPKSTVIAENPPTISWQVVCTAIYGLTSANNSGTVNVPGGNGSANFVIPAHMRDCTASASFNTYGSSNAADATRTLSATLTLFASGNLVSTP